MIHQFYEEILLAALGNSPSAVRVFIRPVSHPSIAIEDAFRGGFGVLHYVQHVDNMSIPIIL